MRVDRGRTGLAGLGLAGLLAVLALFAFGVGSASAARGGNACPPNSPNPTGTPPNCGNGQGGGSHGGGGGGTVDCDDPANAEDPACVTDPPPTAATCAGAALVLVDGAELVCLYPTETACPVGTLIPLQAAGVPGSLCVLPKGAPSGPSLPDPPSLPAPPSGGLPTLPAPPSGGLPTLPAPPALPAPPSGLPALPDPATVCTPEQLSAVIGQQHCLSEVTGGLPG